MSKSVPLRVALGLFLATGLALSAQAEAPKSAKPAAGTARQCFWVSNVNGFNAVDENHVYLNAGVRDVYELKMFGPCNNVDWTQTIGIKPWGGSNSVCTGMDVDLIVPQTGMGPMTCHVQAVRKLTPDEVTALRASRKKK